MFSAIRKKNIRKCHLWDNYSLHWIHLSLLYSFVHSKIIRMTIKPPVHAWFEQFVWTPQIYDPAPIRVLSGPDGLWAAEGALSPFNLPASPPQQSPFIQLRYPSDSFNCFLPVGNWCQSALLRRQLRHPDSRRSSTVFFSIIILSFFCVPVRVIIYPQTAVS